MTSYPIIIHSINIAPQHKVFGKKNEDLIGCDLKSKTRVNLIADSGIEGDRFCQTRSSYNGHITFFSLEAWGEISSALNLPPSADPKLARRNVIISGVDLKALYGSSFQIQNIHFLGTTHCAPCLAMNRALGPGARKAMRSRGGLRAQIKTNGHLQCGPCELITTVRFDPNNAGGQTPSPRIP